MPSTPAFASHSVLLFLALQKCQLGFLVSLYLLSRICSNRACTELFLVPRCFFVFCYWRRGVSRCKHCSKGSQVPACLSPLWETLLLFLRGNRRKICSSETSSRWAPQTLAYPRGVEVPCWMFLGPWRHVGHSAGMSWTPWAIMSLPSNCWSLKDTKLIKRLNKQGPKRRTTIAIKGPGKGRNQVNFGRPSLALDQIGSDVASAKKPLCLSVYFWLISALKFNMLFYF